MFCRVAGDYFFLYVLFMLLISPTYIPEQTPSTSPRQWTVEIIFCRLTKLLCQPLSVWRQVETLCSFFFAWLLFFFLHVWLPACVIVSVCKQSSVLWSIIITNSGIISASLEETDYVSSLPVGVFVWLSVSLLHQEKVRNPLCECLKLIKLWKESDEELL